MSEIGYKDISKIWADEVKEESLRNLPNMTLAKMTMYLSKVRLTLASINTENKIQEELLKQEALNLEFMIRDLLLLRRQKILNLVLTGRHPSAESMTLDEEDFYKEIKTSFERHMEFVESSITGTSSKPRSEQDDDESSGSEYVTVRFLKDIESAFMGLDGREYGPFEKEHVAMIPFENATNLSRDGSVSRVLFEDEAV